MCWGLWCVSIGVSFSLNHALVLVVCVYLCVYLVESCVGACGVCLSVCLSRWIMRSCKVLLCPGVLGCLLVECDRHTNRSVCLSHRKQLLFPGVLGCCASLFFILVAWSHGCLGYLHSFGTFINWLLHEFMHTPVEIEPIPMTLHLPGQHQLVASWIHAHTHQ